MSKKLGYSQLTTLRLEKKELLSHLDRLTGCARETRGTPIHLPLNVRAEIAKTQKKIKSIEDKLRTQLKITFATEIRGCSLFNKYTIEQYASHSSNKSTKTRC